jgi:peptidoglycan/xylan/chitin deacetylase (PgdA/CDA1 family)
VSRRELEPAEDIYWISTEFFREILDLVAPRPTVRLSFDDGNASDVEVALPALLERRLTAAFYPIAARIGQAGFVDSDGLRALVAAGMTVGSHGMWHRPWRGMTDQQLSEELVAARRVIVDDTGVPVDAAACPLGSYDRKVLRRLRRLGYRRVYTSDRARAKDRQWLQPRFSVRNTDSMETVRTIVTRQPDLRPRMMSSARIMAKRLR